VPDDENKPALEARQPQAQQPEAPPEARQPEAHDAAVKFEGSGNLSASAGLAQAAAATFEGSGNLSAVVERGRFVWRPLVDDIKRGRPSPARLFRDEAQRQLASGELPPTLPLNAFARDLLAWFVRERPNARPPQSVRVLEGYVRKLWQAARRT
jgi:hypothetical protein